jgi:RNA polymerase-binding transcription factor DksA
MRREQRGKDEPRWRIILETRWRDRLTEVTELSLAYHGAAETPAGAEDKQARRLLRNAVAARRRLADTEDALRRLETGCFGACEQCGAGIPDVLLAASPEVRYCAGCAVAPRPARKLVPAPRVAAGPA